MNKTFFFMVAIMSNSVLGVNMITFDKGEVDISFDNSKKPYHLEYEKKSDCKADIMVKENGKRLNVYHTSETCLSGTSFKLIVNPLLITNIDMKAGVISVKDNTMLVDKQINIKGYVTAGVINCDKNAYEHQVINYAGQKAFKDFGSNKTFSIKLDAGVMNF